jgi:ribosomal protein L7/L12
MLIGAKNLIGTKAYVQRFGAELVSEIIAVHSSEREVVAYVVLRKGEAAGSVLCVPLNSLRLPLPARKKLQLISVNQETKIATIRLLRECLGYGLQYAVGLVNDRLPAMLGEELDEDKLDELADKLMGQGCVIEFK